MASTTATRRQSEAIRAAMQEIRSELPYDVDDARERVKQLSDWKYHVSQRPLVIMAVAAAAGYLLVPTKRRSEKVIVHHGAGQSTTEPAKRGMLAGILGTLTTLVIRQAATAASRQIVGSLTPGAMRPESPRQYAASAPSEVTR